MSRKDEKYVERERGKGRQEIAFFFLTPQMVLVPKREHAHTGEDSTHGVRQLTQVGKEPHKRKKSPYEWEEMAYPGFEPATYQ